MLYMATELSLHISNGAVEAIGGAGAIVHRQRHVYSAVLRAHPFFCPLNDGHHLVPFSFDDGLHARHFVMQAGSIELVYHLGYRLAERRPCAMGNIVRLNSMTSLR